jgi:hypothetical protein
MITCKNYHNIPQELKLLKQWVCCNDIKTKLPLDPNTLKVASVDNHNTWGTYELAVSRNTNCIGFVFTDKDPYCVIDLDDKPENPASVEQRSFFQAILKQFDTCYTEISQSGFGVHIISKGPIFQGCRKGNVELYSKDRYMIFTGNVLGELKPIEDESESIIGLHKFLSANRTVTPLLWLPATMPDNEVLRMAGEARNGSGVKFQALWAGDPAIIAELNNGNGGQSEADNSLLSLLSFYSQSDEQVIRLFRQSALGKREKAYRDDYIHNSLEKIRASFKKPDIDLSQLDKNLKEAQKESVTKDSYIEYPPGLVGEIAKYIFATSKRPVKDISIAAAIALMSGITQRAYNISDTGLNQYIILIAGTGRGKEDAGQGIDRLVASCRDQLMQMGTMSIVDDFMGPGIFSSGQAIGKVLINKPCFLSVLGEFGKTLNSMTGVRADPASKSILKVLLNVYNKSGFSNYLRGTVYSDSEKNIGDVKSPNITILGEGATDTFYESMDQESIADGLIPRFLVIEYNGPRVPLNELEDLTPPPSLVEKLVNLFKVCYMTQKNENFCAIGRNSEAQKLLKKFGTECDDFINASNNSVEGELWNRAHLKALKLSGVLAIGVDSNNPIVTEDIARWSIHLVKLTTNNLVSKFTSGEIGKGDTKQDHDFKKAIMSYIEMTPKKRRDNYNIAEPLSKVEGVIPYTYLKKHLRLRSSYKNDRRGSTQALDAVISRNIKDGTLIEIPADQAFTYCMTKSTVYTFGPEWH